MCDFALDLDAPRTTPTGVAVLVAAVLRLTALERDGLVQHCDGRLVLPASSRRFVRLVTVCFDTHHVSAVRHQSAAV